MSYNIYVTDYGNVRISQREADVLQAAADMRRSGMAGTFINLSAKARSIEAACRRFAEHRAGLRNV